MKFIPNEYLTDKEKSSLRRIIAKIYDSKTFDEIEYHKEFANALLTIALLRFRKKNN